MSTAHDLIRNTVAHVAIAIDRKDWSSLETFFTSDAAFNFPAPIGVHTSTTSFRQLLQSALKDLSTLHSLTTQTIDISNNSAKVTTYINNTIAVHGQEGEATQTSMGIYEDELVKDEYNGQERWRITKRAASNFA